MHKRLHKSSHIQRRVNHSHIGNSTIKNIFCIFCIPFAFLVLELSFSITTSYEKKKESPIHKCIFFTLAFQPHPSKNNNSTLFVVSPYAWRFPSVQLT